MRRASFFPNCFLSTPRLTMIATSKSTGRAFHHAVRGQEHGRWKERRLHREYRLDVGQASCASDPVFGLLDGKGRTAFTDATSCHGVGKRWHPSECGIACRRAHTNL